MTLRTANDVVVLTQQGLPGSARSLANANHFEAEDVLVDAGGVDRLFFTTEDGALSLRLRRNLGAALRTARPSTPLPSMRGSGPRLGRDYRVAIALIRTVWDVTLLETIADLRERSDRVVIWIFEMWPSECVSSLATLPFHLADLVLVGTTEQAASKLDQLIPVPVHFMPAGIDIDVFGVADVTLDRPIDVMNIGRRDKNLHELLLEQAVLENRHYLFDTTFGAKLGNHREHRWLLAQNYRRAKIAITCAAKFDVEGPDQGQRAMPNRVFEAMAAGAIMAGTPVPSEARQLTQVGSIVVRELPEEPSEAVLEVERLLEADLTDERRESADAARRHHDWSDRWLRLFRLAEAPPTEGIQRRNQRLAP